MNVFGRVAVFVQRFVLEILLVFSVLSLVGQIAWPSMQHWWELPSAGRVGYDRFASDSLAATFAIYLPDSYGDRTAWPLVVFLHGSGDRGNNPTMIRDCGVLRLKLPAIVIVPQCLPSFVWEPEAIASLISHVRSRYRVDEARVYLLGSSMGGYGTWQTAAAHSELFAAIVPICGGGDVKQVKSLVHLPVWAFHGEKDATVPVSESQDMVDAIRAAGGNPRITVLPGQGHAICQEVCSRFDIWEWLLAQKRKQ
jgi:predicted peptidase